MPKPCGLGGVGLTLGDLGNGFALGGIDLDTCREPNTGSVEPWAREVIDQFASYAEVSPSRTGIKVYFLLVQADYDAICAKIDAYGRKFARASDAIHPPAIELYLDKRYFTFIEERLPKMPADPQVVGSGTLRWLLDEAGPAFAPSQLGRDNSRSGKAFRLAVEMMKAGRTREEFAMQPCAPIPCWPRG